jgi:hypothetical protein
MSIAKILKDTIEELSMEKGVRKDDVNIHDVAIRLARNLMIAKNNESLHLVSKSFYSDDAIVRLKTEYFEKGLKANK